MAPMSRKPFYAVLALLTACGTAVAVGDLDPTVNLDSAREIWADVLRDADDVGLQVTRVPTEKEMQLGDAMAVPVEAWGREDPAESRYVTAVGALLLPNVNRTAIRYRFHVIQSPAINAFALPGGHIYVLSGMLGFLQSEAELAAILGHEISHVDLRHCVERYQYQLALKKVGAGDAGEIVELAHSLVAIGYTQFQESEADAAGERLAIEAGYDPNAAAAVSERMKAKFGVCSPPPAQTPLGEAGQAVEQAIGSYFQTHPSSSDRAKRLAEMTASNRRTLAGRKVYVGARNFKDRIPRDAQEFGSEWRVY
jgi:predicted Zn-dependent protease